MQKLWSDDATDPQTWSHGHDHACPWMTGGFVQSVNVQEGCKNSAEKIKGYCMGSRRKFADVCHTVVAYHGP
jgi:hypothetical protein